MNTRIKSCSMTIYTIQSTVITAKAAGSVSRQRSYYHGGEHNGKESVSRNTESN